MPSEGATTARPAEQSAAVDGPERAVRPFEKGGGPARRQGVQKRQSDHPRRRTDLLRRVVRGARTDRLDLCRRIGRPQPGQSSHLPGRVADFPIPSWSPRPTASAPRSRSRSKPAATTRSGSISSPCRSTTSWCKAPSRCFSSTISPVENSIRRSAPRWWRGSRKACRESGCALIGGETAEMPGVYHGGDYDLAGFAVGAAERGALLPRGDIATGDVVIGLASSGVHSNGFSLVRSVVAKADLGWNAPAPFEKSRGLGEALLTPTRLYVKSCLAAIRETKAVKALAHITGGGFLENIPRVLPDGLGVRIDLARIPVLPVFKWLATAGDVAEHEMLRTFNCGIGMVAVIAAGEIDAVTAVLTREGETVVRLGEVIAVKDGPRTVCSGRLDLAGDTNGPQTRRRSDLRSRLQHGGADRGGEGPGLSGRDRARRFEPSRRRWPRIRAERRHRDRRRRSRTVRQGPRSVRARAASRNRSASHRPRLPRRIHATADAVVRDALDRTHAQHPPGLVAGIQGARHPSPRARSRRDPARRDRAFRCAGNGFGPDRAAGLRAGARRRYATKRSPRACSRSSTTSIRVRCAWSRKARSNSKHKKSPASCRGCGNLAEIRRP